MRICNVLTHYLIPVLFLGLAFTSCNTDLGPCAGGNLFSRLNATAATDYMAAWKEGHINDTMPYIEAMNMPMNLVKALEYESKCRTPQASGYSLHYGLMNDDVIIIIVPVMQNEVEHMGLTETEYLFIIPPVNYEGPCPDMCNS